MKANRVWLSVSVFAVAVAIVATSGNAEIAMQTEESLTKNASHAFAGKVVRTYLRKERKDDGYEFTYGVAEMAVESVEKGTDIAAGDRVFVRYWSKKWMETGNPPPDHYGHANVPTKGDVAEVYVAGDRKTGFSVLSPNGFFNVTKQKDE